MIACTTATPMKARVHSVLGQYILSFPPIGAPMPVPELPTPAVRP